MKALTVLQPWASLIAHGQKRYETRSWSTNYRGPLAIHAGKSRWVIEALLEGNPELADLMSARLGHKSSETIGSVPLGAVVAIGELIDCQPTTHVLNRLRTDERAFGNFGPDRFAWEIANVRLLPEPIPTRGAQGLWHWEPPVSRQVSVKMRIEGLVVEVERDDD